MTVTDGTVMAARCTPLVMNKPASVAMLLFI